jgi:hypothetical protein
MMTISMNITAHDGITSSIKRVIAKLKLVPQDALVEFIKDTPIRSGNARRNTKLRGNTIEAKYAYAQKLDDGYSSQSPDGMTKPTEAFIRKRVATILRGR